MSTPLQPPTPGCVHVASLVQARAHKRRYAAVITLEEPACPGNYKMRIHRVPGKPSPAHLVLQFEDVDTTELNYCVATPGQVRNALAFARQHAPGALLVHCLHGVGRSAGIALAVLCDRLGPGQEEEALRQLLAVRPECTPNRVVVALADAELGLAGALVAAVDAWEADNPRVQRIRGTRLAYAKANGHLYARLRPE